MCNLKISFHNDNKYQNLNLKMEKHTKIKPLFCPILWAVVLLLARVHVITDEWTKTIPSPLYFFPCYGGAQRRTHLQRRVVLELSPMLWFRNFMQKFGIKESSVLTKVLSNMPNFPVFLLNFPLLFFSGGSAQTDFHYVPYIELMTSQMYFMNRYLWSDPLMSTIDIWVKLKSLMYPNRELNLGLLHDKRASCHWANSLI